MTGGMIFKGTPGPWHVGYRGMDIGCTNAKIGGHVKLFGIHGWGYLTGNGHGGLGLSEKEAVEVQEANAKLVSASPDLLEALPDLSHVIAWLENGCAPDAAAKELRIYQAKIKAAIAKALGEQK